VSAPSAWARERRHGVLVVGQALPKPPMGVGTIWPWLGSRKESLVARAAAGKGVDGPWVSDDCTDSLSTP